MAVLSMRLAAVALLTVGAYAGVSAARAEPAPQEGSHEARPAELAFLGIGRRKLDAPVRPSPRAAPAGERATEGAERAFRLNPSLTQPLEMPVGRRPQRLLPTRA